MNYLPGTSTVPPLSATFRDSNDNLNDAAPVTFDLIAPNGSTFLSMQVPVRDSLGTYHFTWAIPSDAATGVWTIVWYGTILGEDVDATESFLIGAVPLPPIPGSVVCDLWAQPSDIAGSWTTDEKTTVLTVASDVLYAFSGRQFPGLCTDTVRPVPTSSYDSPPVPIPGFGYRQGGPFGWGFGIQQPWQGCSHGWGCGETRIRLGAEPVVSITSVKIDGVVIDPAKYQIDDHRWLAAVPDPVTGYAWIWPHCQYVDLPATEVGTFEVVYVFGRAAPAGGKAAAIALAAQILKADTDDCQLPANVQQLIRQGVTISMGDPATLFDNGRTGIKTVDRWLESVNPHHLNEPGRVLSPDLPRQVVHADT